MHVSYVAHTLKFLGAVLPVMLVAGFTITNPAEIHYFVRVDWSGRNFISVPKPMYVHVTTTLYYYGVLRYPAAKEKTTTTGTFLPVLDNKIHIYLQKQHCFFFTLPF